MKKLLEHSKLLTGLSDEFLRDVVVFIEDMRMLKNIVTEYAIYKDTLKSSIKESEYKRLFSFIIYKNIYCNDFAKLQGNQGTLAEFFKNKRVLQHETIQNYQQQIEQLETKVAEIEGENLLTINELNAVFIIAATLKFNNTQVKSINDEPLANFAENTNVDEIFKNNVPLQSQNFHGQIFNEGTLSKYNGVINPSYTKRKELIESKDNDRISLLNDEIRSLKRQIKHCKKSSVKDLSKLVTKEKLYAHLDSGVDKKYSSEHIDYTLLIHLIKKGYINEMYHVYISHFLEGHLTKSDMDFVLKVKSNESLNSETLLTNKVEIVEYLNSDDFNNEGIFNYDLINHLISENESDHLKTIVNTVKNTTTSLGIKNIYESLNFIENIQSWLMEVANEWQEVWKEIIDTDNLKQNEKNEFLITLIINIYGKFKESLLPINNKNQEYLKQYINDIPNFSNFLPTNTDEYSLLIKVLEYLKIEFTHISAAKKNNDFIDDIINCDLFPITPNNYQYLISFITEKPIKNINMSLSAIRLINNKALLEHIDRNIDTFVSDVLFNETFTIGDETSCLYLLNHQSLLSDLKKEFIDEENYEITNLADIKDKNLWPQILTSNKLIVSWSNISVLLEETQLYTETIEYIQNKNIYSILTNSTEKQHTLDFDNQIDGLINMLITANFNILAFQKYCPLFKDKLLNIPLSKLPTEQVNVLIDLRYIEFTEEVYDDIEFNHPESLIKFIESKFSHITQSEIYPNLFFSAQDMEVLLNSTILSNTEKESVSLKLAEDTTTISGKLFANYYSIYSQKLVEMPVHILRLLISLNFIDNTKRVHILSLQIPYISQELTFDLLSKLNDQYIKIATTKSQCRLDRNKANENLANALVNKGYFSMSELNKSMTTIRLNKKGK